MFLYLLLITTTLAQTSIIKAVSFAPPRTQPLSRAGVRDTQIDLVLVEFTHSEQVSNDIPVGYYLPSTIAPYFQSNIDFCIRNTNEMFTVMSEIEEAFDKLVLLLPQISHSDNNNDYSADMLLDTLLYHLNVKIDVFRYSDWKTKTEDDDSNECEDTNNLFMPVVYKYFQQKLYHTKYLPIIQSKYDKYEFSSVSSNSNNNNSDHAINEIKGMALGHRICTHSFLDLLAAGNVSVSLYDTFLENYYVNNRAFHLMVGGLPFIAPLKFRSIVYQNCFDETGGSSGLPSAHPTLFLKNFGFGTDTNNSSSRNMPSIVYPFQETFQLFNTKAYIAFQSKSYEFSFGAFGFLESTMPQQMVPILSGAKKLGYNRAERIFWQTHISVDEVHGSEWFELLESMLAIQNHATSSVNDMIAGGLFLLDARVAIYDKMLQLYREEEKACASNSDSDSDSDPGTEER